MKLNLLKKKPKKRAVAIAAAAIVIIIAAVWSWCYLAAPTHIAFVNYQAINLGQISKANDSHFIKIAELTPEELDKAKNFDMVFVNAMGLRITEEQREALQSAADNGTPVLSTAVTNPMNNIVSADSIDCEYMKQYLTGGRANYRNLLHYVRYFVDGKRLFAPIPNDPQLSQTSLLYYPSENDDLNFASVAEYESWLRKNNKWKENAPRILLTGQMGVPDSLVNELEKAGNMVYPVNMIQTLITKGHADSISAAAIINMAHGRMGDMVTSWLSEKNIPLFSPLNVNQDYDEWMNDKMGMSGGFLSQSVVTPEIDGAIRPFTLFAHYKGEDGLPYVAAIPDRLREFVATINNYITLQRKDNAQKKVAIFYFKGPGQNALVAEGMDVAPSLYNMLSRMKSEGYKINLPASAEELQKLINENGKVFNHYAEGAMQDFVKTAHPQIISQKDYDSWTKAQLSERMRAAIDSVDGKFPGHGLKDATGNMAIARIDLGNVVLIPQTSAGIGDDDFKIVHGTDAAPTHTYVASYLWAKNGFKADALMHFGAHGSLEFTPRKQAALGSEDWPDRLVGTLPHFYIYSTSNVGEAMTAKRRSYAGIINYLTPPFMESNVRGIYKNLTDAISTYNKSQTQANALAVKKYTVNLGIHRELRLDSALNKPYTEEEIARIESFADELANEKITGALYIMGQPYAANHIRSTVLAMTVDPLAYSMQKLAARNGSKTPLATYRSQSQSLIESLLSSTGEITDARICAIVGISQAELDSARNIQEKLEGGKDFMSKMMVMGSTSQAPKQKALSIADRLKKSSQKSKKHGMIPGMSADKALAMAKAAGASEEQLQKMKAAMSGNSGGKKNKKGGSMMPMRPEVSPEQMEFANAVTEVERAIKNVSKYRSALETSPSAEITSVINALNGGFIIPTSGGDPVLNPDILPTGRNMFAINAEETPSQEAWEEGKALANKTIEMYRKAHNDSVPRKVSYTLWSSEFIETGGATIAQVLYMLGVEPIRDPFGRVTDIRLIPSEELGRSRIDVVVQTSGQLRDLAASRLFLISRAVKMAAEAKNDKFPNFVNEGVLESEKHLVDKGISPKEARELSTSRVFGGVNGNYGTGITGMVESGDKWDSEKELAETYLQNMGADYSSEETWEQVREFAFEAALTRTDVVVQPRQSNTWGALSLDHVYEFMGGLNMAVRNVTGKDPDAYLADYRNRNNTRMQELKEAVGVESRTTILNPTYIKEKMKGGAADAAAIADVVRNTYGWNVMKPDVIDDELWNDIYDTYVKDVNNLGVTERFNQQNPAAMQEMTAVMLETARKGMWDASPEQLKTLSKMHTDLIKENGPGCSGFVCDNSKLKEYIKKNVDAQSAQQYSDAVANVRAEKTSADNGKVMKKEELNSTETSVNYINGIVVGGIVLALIVIFIFISHRRRKNSVDDDINTIDD